MENSQKEFTILFLHAYPQKTKAVLKRQLHIHLIVVLFLIIKKILTKILHATTWINLKV